ncbi:hypothetical protein [Stenotrophomonas sp.]|uniref:hypothetical protein n=1 Tax=Stenotrophomonas sp. TaxID=69392 RepID=UPI0028ACD703|nr:hypothetical protein [Stenotrophomonas sp.]
MMRAKAFQAQALDNTSEDHLRGADAADELRSPVREQTYSAMAAVSSRGVVLFTKYHVRLFCDGQSAVLQVVTEERDQAGRLAPVMCWVEHDGCGQSARQDIDGVWTSLVQFAAAIDRSFSDTTHQAACEALEAFEKKKSFGSRSTAASPTPRRWPWLQWLMRLLKALRIFKN